MKTCLQIMKFKLLALLAFSFPLLAPGQDVDYLPGPIEGHQIVSYTQFTLSYNEEHEQADWVAYELNKAELQQSNGDCSSSCFKEDENISTGSASLDDYSSSGFDRGHLCPSKDNDFSQIAQEESYLLSNITPQIPSLNQGVWVELEDWVREKAIESERVVVCGPVFINNLGKMGPNDLTIPGYYFKVVLKYEDDKPKTIGFLIPQIGATGNFQDYQVPVNTIETLTGINFFPFLEDRIENSVEAQMGKRSWGL